MRVFGICCLLAAALTGGAMAAELPGTQFNYGAWSGRAYTDDTTGRFSHCAISADYTSGEALMFSVNADASISVALVFERPVFQVGESFPVTLRVDRKPPFHGTAEAFNEYFAVLRLTDFERAMIALQRGYRLVIDARGGSSSYDLDGTFRALSAALDCAVDNFERTTAPVPQTPPPVAEAPAPVAEAPAPVVDKTVLFQVATEMISELGLTDSRYLNAEETLSFTNADAVFWVSNSTGLVGGTIMVDRAGIASLRETDGVDQQYLAAFCHGDYATSFRDLPLTGVESRELRMLCTDEHGSSELYLTKIAAGELVLYTMLFFDDDVPGNGTPSATANQNVSARAASFVVENGMAE